MSSLVSPRHRSMCTCSPAGRRLLRADVRGDTPGWVADHRDALRAVVAEHGSVLVRGLGLRDADRGRRRLPAAGRWSDGRTGGLRAPAGLLRRRVLLDEWPPNQPMCMHHELSYRFEFPGLMLFACLTAPTAGGATARGRRADGARALPAELVERFEREGWLLDPELQRRDRGVLRRRVRHRRPGAVESYCRANAIEFQWQPDGGLRTGQRRSAVVRHPVTGRRCWFNQIAFLNEWTMAPEVREYLVDVYGADGLPFNTRYGNGDPIGDDVVQLLNQRLRGRHRSRALAGRGPAARRQRPHRAQPGALRRTARSAGRHGRPGRLADCSPTVRGDRRMTAVEFRRSSGPRLPEPPVSALPLVRGDLRRPGPATRCRDARSRSWSWSRPLTGCTAPAIR